MSHYVTDPEKILVIRDAMLAGNFDLFFDFMDSDGLRGLFACLDDPMIAGIFARWQREMRKRVGGAEAASLFRRAIQACCRAGEKDTPK